MASAFKFLGGVDELEIFSIFHQCAEHFIQNENVDLFVSPFNYQFNWYNISIKSVNYNIMPTIGCIVYTLQMEYQNCSRLITRVNPL